MKTVLNSATIVLLFVLALNVVVAQSPMPTPIGL
jgi:hypothetical protein